MKSGFLGFALSLVACAALAGQPVTIVDKTNTNSVGVTNAGEAKVDCTTGCNGGGVVTGNQSNAGAGTTGSANVGVNAYEYCYNAGWVQNTGAACPITIGGPIGRSADAASVSSALSTEDVALLNSIITNTGGAIPAGTNLIGKTGIDQTTPGTTNNVAVSTNGAGNTPLIQATASLPISSTGAATTLLLAASGSTTIYVTHVHYVLSGAGTVALIAGTGSTCAGSTHYLDGASGHPMSFAANGGISAGGGIGYIYKTNASDALCIVTTGSVDTSGDFSYAQF